MSRIKAGLTLGLCLSVFGMLGCSEDATAPAPPPSPPQQPAKPQLPEAVSIQEAAPVVQEYVYDPSGKRDPFQPLLTVRKPVAQQEAPLTPLQQYDLGQFRLIAAIIGKGEPTAMIEAPGGKPFVIKKGIKIGKNNGTVVDISSNAVSIEERYYDFSGAVRKSMNQIQFPPREGVKRV